MKEKINILKNLELKTWSLLIAIIADCIYVLNLIMCVRKYSKLKTSNPSENIEKEKGLMEYISSHQAGQILFIIGIVLLIVAVILLFTQYVKEKEGILKIVMAICLVCIIIFIVGCLLEDIYLKLNIYNSIFDLIRYISGTIISFLSLASLLISFIVFLFNKDYRGNMFMLIASAVWFAFGYAIIILGIGLIIFAIISAIFSSDSGDHELREYDGNGNLIGRWIKKG